MNTRILHPLAALAGDESLAVRMQAAPKAEDPARYGIHAK